MILSEQSAINWAKGLAQRDNLDTIVYRGKQGTIIAHVGQLVDGTAIKLYTVKPDGTVIKHQ